MKVLRVAVMLAVTLCVMCQTRALCAQDEVIYEQAEYLKVEDKVGQYIKGDNADTNLLGSLYKTIEKSQSGIKKAILGAVYDCLLILLTAIICSAAGSFYEESSGKRMINLAAAAAVSLICLGKFNSVIGIATGAIADFDGLIKSSLPAITSIMTVGGMPATAAMKQFGAMLFSQIFMEVTDKITLPLINAYIAVSIAGAVSDAFDFKTLGESIKSFAIWVIKVLMLAYTGYVIIQGSLSYASDSFAVKSLKFTLSSAVPVLGSILGDAAGAVLQSAVIIKNTLGVVGIISAIDLAILPVIEVGAIYIILKITSAVISPFAGKEICGLVSNLSSAFNILFIIMCSCAVICIVTFATAITAVSPI